jgi:hypothetical protein
MVFNFVRIKKKKISHLIYIYKNGAKNVSIVSSIHHSNVSSIKNGWADLAQFFFF